MFCPECRYEFIGGINECPDCKVPLVEELPPEPQSPPKQKLKYAALSAIIGISYIFALRTLGTFLPDIFKNILAAQVTGIMSLLASLTVVFFFISFYKDYVQKEQTQLKKVSVLAIIGFSALSLLHIKSLLLVFKVHIFLYLIKPHYFEPIVPLVSSITILLFFIVFYKETLHKEQIMLKKAAFLAVIGSSIAALLRTFILFNYFYFKEVRWFSDLSGKILIIFTPIYIFVFVTVLYFFVSFYKEQKRAG